VADGNPPSITGIYTVAGTEALLLRKVLGGTGFQPVQHRLKTCATNIFS